MASGKTVTQLPVTNRVTSVNRTTDVLHSRIATSNLQPGEVALVGAGPGDVELLTLKALRFMQQADVVLYDYLVSDDIMACIPDETVLVCVGKRAGHHSVPQEKTNQLMIDFAKQGNRVVRIKGGDPFIFGRGGEELEALWEEGISFQVVPGITSAAGATAYAGIPLTHRDYAQSAMFVTGHVKADGKNLDWSTMARSNQTLVIYMGLMNSQYIKEQLIEHGRHVSTPVAVIERGTQAAQKVVTGTLGELAQLASQAQAPALIVIGEVVSLATKLSWFSGENQPVQNNAQYA